MIALLHCHHFSGYSRYADRPLVLIELSLPAPGYSKAQCARAWQDIDTIGVGSGEDQIEFDAENTRPESVTFAALVLALLRAGGQPLASAVIEAGQGETARVQIRSDEGPGVERAARLAVRLLSDALTGQPMASMQGAVNAMLKEIRPRVIDPNALLLVQAARERRLPVMWLDRRPFEETLEGRTQQFGLFKVGQGAAGRVLAGPLPQPDNPQKLDVYTNRGHLLQQLIDGGFNAPAFLLELSPVHSASRAVRTGARLGAPLRVCPLVRSAFAYRQSVQASFGSLTDAEQLKTAFERVAAPTGSAWVEAEVPGRCYRFLLIGGRVLAIAERRPPEIVGDGKTRVEALIRRAEASGNAIGEAVSFHDADVALRLRLAGLELESVLPPGQRLALRAEGTPYNGGHCQDVTGQVSTEIRELAETVARHFGLDELAGIDLALIDPQGAAGQDNCTVLDVLPDPDLLSHASNSADIRSLTGFFNDGVLKGLAHTLLDALFPLGQDGRIPLIAVTGTNGKTTTVRMIEQILRQRFHQVACTTTEGARIGNTLIRDSDSAGAHSAMLLLSEDEPDAAVLETARGGLIARGIAFDHCDVGVCLNLGDDHLGVDGIETLDQLAEIKGEVIRRASRAAVLNADEPRVLAMQDATSADDLVLVSQQADNPVIATHCQQGGRAIVLEGSSVSQQIVEWTGSKRELIIAVNDIPATHAGAAFFNIENACFAVAATRAIGLSVSEIQAALGSFDTSHDCNPGRFNLFDGLHCQVLIDHAQNVPAMEQLGRAVAALPCRGQRWLLLRALGNRSNKEIQALATAATGFFDRYHCTNFDLLREREPNEVPGLLERALQDAGVAPSALITLADEDKAVEDLLARAGPEDLVVMLYLGDGHRRIWDKLECLAAAQRTGHGAQGQTGQVGHA